jgi:hypothetical protein
MIQVNCSLYALIIISQRPLCLLLVCKFIVYYIVEHRCRSFILRAVLCLVPFSSRSLFVARFATRNRSTRFHARNVSRSSSRQFCQRGATTYCIGDCTILYRCSSCTYVLPILYHYIRINTYIPCTVHTRHRTSYLLSTDIA